MKNRSFRVVTGVGLSAMTALLLVTGGCGSANRTVDLNAFSGTTKSVTTTNGMELTLSEDRASVAVGESVNYTLTITNRTGQPVTYTPVYPCEQQSLIDGLTSYLSLQGETGSIDARSTSYYLPSLPYAICGITGYGSPVTIAPGKSLSHTISSAAFTGKGTYVITAHVANAFNLPASPLAPMVEFSGITTTVN